MKQFKKWTLLTTTSLLFCLTAAFTVSTTETAAITTTAECSDSDYETEIETLADDEENDDKKPNTM